MKTTNRKFTPGITDKNWFKKGHKLPPESIEKMRKAKTKYTPEQLKQRNKDRSKDPHRIEWTIQYKKSPKRKYDTYKRSAVFKHIVFELSFDSFSTFWQKNCIYCGDTVETIGLDRIDNKQGYVLGNIVPCCKFCNYMKREMTKEAFLTHCLKVAKLNCDNKIS